LARDLKKKETCACAGIILIHIPYWYVRREEGEGEGGRMEEGKGEGCPKRRNHGVGT
jgi:hypothetical protein